MCVHLPSALDLFAEAPFLLFVCFFFWFLKRKSGGCHRWNPFGGGKSKKLRN